MVAGSGGSEAAGAEAQVDPEDWVTDVFSSTCHFRVLKEEQLREGTGVLTNHTVTSQKTHVPKHCVQHLTPTQCYIHQVYLHKARGGASFNVVL